MQPVIDAHRRRRRCEKGPGPKPGPVQQGGNAQPQRLSHAPVALIHPARCEGATATDETRAGFHHLSPLERRENFSETV